MTHDIEGVSDDGRYLLCGKARCQRIYRLSFERCICRDEQRGRHGPVEHAAAQLAPEYVFLSGDQLLYGIFRIEEGDGNLMSLQGRAETGKTYLTNQLINILMSMNK